MGCDAYHDMPPEDDSLNFEKLGVSFQTLNEKILIPKCLRCHRSGKQSNHFIDLSSYNSIVSSGVFPPLVVEGKPEESSLYTSVREFRMPEQGTKLIEQEIEYIRNWILLGAKREKVSSKKPRDPGDTDEPGDDCKDDNDPDEPGGERGSDEPGDSCKCKKNNEDESDPPDAPGEPGEPGEPEHPCDDDSDPNEP